MNKKAAIERELLLKLLFGLLILLAILVIIFPPAREFIVSKITHYLSYLRFGGGGGGW